MSTLLLDLDPREIRLSLEELRERGIVFDLAWHEATHGRCCDGEVLKFMRKHFEAAYYDNDSTLGRCLVPERDVSVAIGASAERAAISAHRRCRWGGGCDRSATRGRFGKTWCEDHGAELATIGSLVPA